jgi:hypothetical protein
MNPTQDAFRDEIVESGEILRIAGVDGRVVGVRGGGDEEVHYARAGLATDLG